MESTHLHDYGKCNMGLGRVGRPMQLRVGGVYEEKTGKRRRFDLPLGLSDIF